MKKQIILVVIIPLLLISCAVSKQTEDNIKSPEYQMSCLSSKAFKKHILGEWESAWQRPKHKNILYLRLGADGTAKLRLGNGDSMDEITGEYSVSFVRPPDQKSITIADIIISSSIKNVKLSRVSFGLHNACPPDKIYLRVSKPNGVLQRIEKKNS